MTVVDVDEDASLDPAGVLELPRQRGRRKWPWVVAAGIAVSVLVGAGWPIAAAVGRGAVVVRQDVRPWVCQSGTVQNVNVGDDDTQTQYASLVTVAPGMHCQLRIIVDNNGSRPVTVNRVTIPFFGRTSVYEVAAVQLDGDITTVTPDRTGGDTDDARFTIPGGLTVEAGSSEVLSVTVMYQKKKSGCSLQEGTSVSDLDPTVKVTSWGIPGDVVQSSPPFGLAGGKDCP